MMMICRVSPPRGFPVGEEVIGHLVPIGSGQWRAGHNSGTTLHSITSYQIDYSASI